MLCYFLCNFNVSLQLLLWKAYNNKNSDCPSFSEEEYEDIIGNPIAQWSPKRTQKFEQLINTIGEHRTQKMIEETLYFLIFHIVNNCCGPYLSKKDLIRLLDRFYEVAFTEWMPISPSKDSYNKYAKSRNYLEKFMWKLITIFDVNIFTGLKMSIPAAQLYRDIKSVIDKFFTEPHHFELG